ncbi:hypothetical protein [Steroidobacter cummioxidans]|uniref:hypothetical protein n=1 Tax=Steroidobacter cummioxidans TaxID=1803913 RepID=UPI000E30F0A9|nr:hypothetical protein [Steroidobacter cummioxidans]
MRLIKLALAFVAVSTSWVASATPAINSTVSGSIAVPAAATTQMVAGPAQVRLDGNGLSGNLTSNLSNDVRASSGSAPGSMDDSMSRGWLMALVTVLLIGHQLRRKHRFLRPQRFSDL